MAASLAVLAPLLGPLSCQATLIVPLVLVPRLAGPGHPARPDLLLRTPRDPQNILLVQKELDRDLSFSVVL